MAILTYALHNLDLVLRLTAEHVLLVVVALSGAILTGVPFGIGLAHRPRLAAVAIGVLSVITTIPSVALFGLLLPLLAIVGQGIGPLPAMIAVFLYAQLPITRNTIAALRGVDGALREAAKGMGMTRRQRLRRVELPIALPIILAGVRTALVTNIGVMTIAAYVGAGGLGVLISRGISQSDPRQLVTGALAVSLLAVLADTGLLMIQRRLTRTKSSAVSAA